MAETSQYMLRFRDVLVGGIACFLFGVMAHHTGHIVLSTLASMIFGYVVALASMHLWMPWVLGQNVSADQNQTDKDRT